MSILIAAMALLGQLGEPCNSGGGHYACDLGLFTSIDDAGACICVECQSDADCGAGEVCGGVECLDPAEASALIEHPTAS